MKTKVTCYFMHGVVSTDWDHPKHYHGQAYPQSNVCETFVKMDKLVTEKCREYARKFDDDTVIRVEYKFNLNSMMAVVICDDDPMYFLKVSMNIRIGHQIIPFLDAIESARYSHTSIPHWRYIALELFIKNFMGGVHYDPVAVNAMDFYPVIMCANPDCQEVASASNSDDPSSMFYLPEPDFYCNPIICKSCNHTTIGTDMNLDVAESFYSDDQFIKKDFIILNKTTSKIKDYYHIHFIDSYSKTLESTTEAAREAVIQLSDHDTTRIELNVVGDSYDMTIDRLVEVDHLDDETFFIFTDVVIEAFNESDAFHTRTIDSVNGVNYTYERELDDGFTWETVDQETWLRETWLD